MRLPIDTTLLRAKSPRDLVVFAAQASQESLNSTFFTNFNDECIVVASGIGEHAISAAKLACESAIWAYKIIRNRNYYWEDKKLFLKRIFRTTGLTLWQKRKAPQFDEHIAISMLVCLTSGSHIWIGNRGNLSALHVISPTNVSTIAPSSHQLLLGQIRYDIHADIYAAPFRVKEYLFISNTYGIEKIMSLIPKIHLEQHIPHAVALANKLEIIQSLSHIDKTSLLLALHRTPIVSSYV